MDEWNVAMEFVVERNKELSQQLIDARNAVNRAREDKNLDLPRLDQEAIQAQSNLKCV